MINLKNELKKTISDEFLVNYFVKKFESKKYRGQHFTQHNRFTINDIKTILNEMKNLGRIEILVGDDKGTYPQCISKYIELVNTVRSKNVDTSINGLKKHFFVDMHRMGFIRRFDKNGKEFLNPFKKCTVKYVEISQSGLKFINDSNSKEQTFQYMQAIDKLSRGFLKKAHDFFLAQIENLSPEQRKRFKMNRYDFALFVLSIDCEFNNETFSFENIIDLYKIWANKLTKIGKETIIKLLIDWCLERKELKKQSTKRDWGNFLNNCDQIIDIFSQTSFFECDSDHTIYLKFGTSTSMFDDIRDCSRSLIQKHEYFKKHTINKSKGYRLHHIVPLNEAKNIAEYKMFDVWENMIYIQGTEHDKIHDSAREKLYILEICNNKDINFVSIFDEKLKLICVANHSLFNFKLKDIMSKKNEELLEYLN